jgi:Kef-type K+ transport system membrane component KefB
MTPICPRDWEEISTPWVRCRVDRHSWPNEIDQNDGMIASQVLYSVEMGLLLLAVCVLVGPIVAERVRVPGLVGLIAIGTVFGPNVLEWLRPAGFVATVGAAGLLYLMFLAGIELDLKTFAANRAAAITFGLLTFCIPFSIAFAVGRWHMGLGISGSALIGAMWASHTVVAYPEAKAAGLDRNRAVGAAVAATVITDVLALIVLAVAASSASLDETPGTRSSGGSPALPLWAGLILLVVFCLVVLPRMTRWAFAHLFRSRTQRFVWLLGGMAAGGVMGLLGGIEGLVGAFLAGISMNTAVPARSELMERVEFVGNSLLIPAFLVSVGLSIDPASLVEPSTLRLAGIFIVTVVIGKSLAAIAAGRLFSFHRGEIAIMAALTIGQAAATLAIAQVGVATGLFDQKTLNAAVVTVVGTVLITSFGTRIAARSIDSPTDEVLAIGEHVLAQAPATAAVPVLADIVSAIARGDGGLITPFAIDTSSDVSFPDAGSQLAEFADALTRLGHDTHPIVRVGESLSAATLSLAREQSVSLIVLPIVSRSFPLDLPFGSDIDRIGSASPAAVAVVRLVEDQPQRIVVITGSVHDAAQRADLAVVALIVERFAKAKHLPIAVASPTGAAVDAFDRMQDVAHTTYEAGSGDVLTMLRAGDLVIVPSHVVADASVIARIRLRRALKNVSVMVVGGPRRLSVSLRRSTRPLIGIVNSRET